MARPSARPPIGQGWQNYITRESEERQRAFERQRSDAYERERRRADLDNMRFHEFRDRQDNGMSSGGNGNDDSLPELETRRFIRPSGVPQPPLTPPASEVDSTTGSIVLGLQDQIDSQVATIRRLESDLGSEQTKVRDFQNERHEAIRAQRQAIVAGNEAEVARLRTQNTNLLELLDQAEEREKKLEQQIDEGRKRESDLRTQQREAQRRIQELEDNADAQQHAETTQASRNPEPRNGPEGAETLARRMGQVWQYVQTESRIAASREELWDRESEVTRDTSHSLRSGRSRRQDEQMRRNGFVEIPKRSGRRVRVPL